MMSKSRTDHRRIILALALASLLSAGPPERAIAQLGAPGSAADNEPIQIQADSGIEWQQNARLYIARGNAVAARGSSEVRADTLTAHYREAKGGGGNTEIYRVEATGNVRLKRDANTVIGERAVYDVDQGIAVVTGRGLKLITANDVVTARDSLEWHDQRQVAVARGDAVASRAGKTIKADILTAYLQKAPQAQPKPVVPGAGSVGESKISRVDAQGSVVITNAQDTGRGDFGVYNGETGIATLIGNVVIQRGNNVIRGQRGVMDLNNNIARMMPGGPPGEGRQRVQGLFIRDGQGTPAPAAGGTPGRDPAANAKRP